VVARSHSLMAAARRAARFRRRRETALVFRSRPLIEHVFAALNKSQIERVVTVTSPELLARALGKGSKYSGSKGTRARIYPRLQVASKRLGLQGPVLIIAADLPLIDIVSSTGLSRVALKQRVLHSESISPTSFAMRPM